VIMGTLPALESELLASSLQARRPVHAA
jgi:hypothetical protein